MIVYVYYSKFLFFFPKDELERVKESLQVEVTTLRQSFENIESDIDQPVDLKEINEQKTLEICQKNETIEQQSKQLERLTEEMARNVGEIEKVRRICDKFFHFTCVNIKNLSTHCSGYLYCLRV